MTIPIISANISRMSITIIQYDHLSREKIAIKTLKTSNVFVNASIVYILANGIGQGTTLLANIFFTRYMSQRDYGLFSNYYSYVSLLVPFVGMNLYCGLANAYIDYKNVIHKLRSSLLLLSLSGLAVTTLAMILLKLTVGLSLSMICIFLALAHAYGFFLVNYYIHSMNMENRFVAKGVMLSVPYVIQALFAIIALVICNSYISRAIGGTVGVLVCGLTAALLIMRGSCPQLHKEYWSYALRISLPAIIGSVSAMIMQQCDKVMITSISGAEINAIYSLIYYIGYILYAVQQATNGGLQVWLYNTLDKKKVEGIPNVQKWYLFAMLVLTTGIYMIAPEIVKILSPIEYWHFEYVVPFIIGSFLMAMYSMLILVVQYKKKNGVVSLIVSLSAVINILLNFLLIPKFGGVGAAYTSVVSYLFIFIICLVYLKIKQEYFFSDSYFYVSLLIVVLLGAAFYFVKDLILLRYVIFLAALFFEAVYFYHKFEEVKSLFGGSIFARR